ncbi:MAG: hypothetical protein M1375_03865 [Candidatus Thermoplasmatota archaeon]|jgi:hypothetical protein|nr:hypothetical protein [Candidatus Thermoplasmatota archaeon]MCL5791090.1 hypothetical protein [Candidatus Thermoplasmatota archaeon]
MEEWEKYSRNLGYGVLFTFILFFSMLILLFLGSPQAAYVAFFNIYGLLGYVVIVLSIGLYGIYLIWASVEEMRSIRNEVIGKRIRITGTNPLGYPYGFYKGMRVLFDEEQAGTGEKTVIAGGFRMDGTWPTGLYVYSVKNQDGDREED